MTEVVEVLKTASKIQIIQAENPDADSLGSAIGLYEALLQLGKQITLYCPVDIPRHLRYIKGWEQVNSEMIDGFDVSVVVDTSASALLEKAFNSLNTSKLLKKPLVVIDHHNTKPDINHPEQIHYLDAKVVATGEMLVPLIESLGAKLNRETAEPLVAAILSDSLGLTSKKTTVETIRTLAKLVEDGELDLSELDQRRREWGKKTKEILLYKADLIKRLEFYRRDTIALLTISLEEIKQYSDLYNPSALVGEDMRGVENVDIFIALKVYDDHITGRLRANKTDICDKIAEDFGGGGHPYAAGFKIKHSDVSKIKVKLLETITNYLDKYEKI